MTGQIESIEHTITHLSLELKHYEQALKELQQQREKIRRMADFTQIVIDRVSNHQLTLGSGFLRRGGPEDLMLGAAATSGPPPAVAPPIAPVAMAIPPQPTVPTPSDVIEIAGDDDAARCAAFSATLRSARPPAPEALQGGVRWLSTCAEVPILPAHTDAWQQMIIDIYDAIDGVPAATQQTLLRALSDALNRVHIAASDDGASVAQVADVLVQRGAFDLLTRLLRSINNNLRSEAAQAVAALCQTTALKDAFGRTEGLEVLIQILSRSPVEVVVEKVLACVWTLAMTDYNKRKIGRAGGLQTIVELLHIDSERILDSATIALGYLTRDDQNKISIRECHGIERLLATLYYPSESIQSKAAGALWNCASNAENKVAIRKLGGLPPMIELLSSKFESVQENVAGGLWNCAVDQENKRLVRELGGLQPLIALLSSTSEAVVENASGTLWNCTAVGENRVALRKLGGLAPLLRLLQHPNESVQDNAAGAVRNSAINDQNKVAFRDLNGLQLFLDLLPRVRQSVLEKLTSTLWICSINPDNKDFICKNGGFPRLLALVNSPNHSICERALGILRNCSSLPSTHATLRKDGVLQVLVNVLARAQSHGVREYAAATVWNVCRDPTARSEAAGLGMVPVLLSLLHEYVSMLSAGAPQAVLNVLDHVLGAIALLSQLPAVRSEVVRDAQVLPALVRAATGASDGVTENALALLHQLLKEPSSVGDAVDLGLPATAVQVLRSQCPPNTPVKLREGLMREAINVVGAFAAAKTGALGSDTLLSGDLEWVAAHGPEALRPRAQNILGQLGRQ